MPTTGKLPQPPTPSPSAFSRGLYPHCLRAPLLRRQWSSCAHITFFPPYFSAAGAVQPDDTKSTTQKASDSVRGGSDDASQQSKGVLQSAQETIGNAAQSLSDTLSGNTKK